MGAGGSVGKQYAVDQLRSASIEDCVAVLGELEGEDLRMVETALSTVDATTADAPKEKSDDPQGAELVCGKDGKLCPVKLQSLFDRLDADEDGYVTRAEAERWLREPSLKGSISNLSRIFQPNEPTL